MSESENISKENKNAQELEELEKMCRYSQVESKPRKLSTADAYCQLTITGRAYQT
jgi:hypothetical protein